MHFIRFHPWILPTVIFAILVLLGANMHPLWGDEAETALFARNILRCGVPCGWDGTNIMGINDAVVLNKDLINHTSPWGQYYFASFSFKLFGESSFTARLPFILLSIISLPLLYLLSLKITGNKRTAFLAILILSLSVPFILFSYQARYYSITTFAGIILVLSVLNLSGKKLLYKITFILAGVLFFYANYVVFIAFYTAVFVSYCLFLLFQKKPIKETFRFFLWFAGLSILIAAATAPWYIIMKPFGTRGTILSPELTIEYIQGLLTLYKNALSPYNLNNGFPVLFVPLFLFVLIWLFRKKQSVAGLVFISSIPAIFLFIMTLFTALAQVDTLFFHARYTMNIFAFLSLTVSMLFAELWKLKKEVVIVVLALYLFTNVFTLQKPQFYLVKLLGEIVHPYSTPDKVVADYLQAKAKHGDTAFVNLDRDHEPLIFLLKDKIRFVNRVTFTNTRIFPKNRSVLPKYIYFYLDEPDWIILYSKRGNDGSFFTFDYRGVFPLGLAPTVDLKNHYEEVVLPVFFTDMSRPEIDFRSFKEVIPEYRDQVFIYKKIK